MTRVYSYSWSFGVEVFTERDLNKLEFNLEFNESACVFISDFWLLMNSRSGERQTDQPCFDIVVYIGCRSVGGYVLA